jgi:hypothetical protein
MKLAPWIALAAVALFVAAATVPKEMEPEEVVVALDLSGIDTVVVASGTPEIVLRYAAEASVLHHRPQLHYDVRREGSTLTLALADSANRYDDGEVSLPRSLRRLVVQGGTVNAHAAPVALEVETSGDVEWHGDAGSLLVVDRTHQERTCRECATTVKIAKGHIAELTVRTRSGTVELDRAEQLGRVHLELGADADYRLGGLQGKPPAVLVTGLSDVAIP